ncbi:MAG: hypothetical protein JNL21_35130 [Myxococcales bacterium]|nr:hypothetical protein [Myxococcales bacterium]
MSGVTGRPEHGLRVEIVLDEAASTPERAVYRGALHEPDRSRQLEAVATARGVELTLDPNDDALVRVIAPLVRAATKAELVQGDPPPRKIVRWRPRADG